MPETRLPYAVVEFTAVNEVEVVPINWLTGGKKNNATGRTDSRLENSHWL